MSNKLDRYIKTKNLDKTELVVTSLNLEKRQKEFLNRKNLNLSKIVRDHIDELMEYDSRQVTFKK